MTTHAEARKIIETAFGHVFGRAPTPTEALFVQAVGLHESGYGQKWTGEGVGSHNWGAIQGTGNAGFFTHGDTHERGEKYTTKFRRYLSDQDGADDLVKQVYGPVRPGVLEAAREGQFEEAITRMRKAKYFEAPLSSYISAIDRAMQTIGGKLGEVVRPLALPALTGLPPSPPSSSSTLFSSSILKRGSISDDVKRWQRIVHVDDDGVFGPITERATRLWQRVRGLSPDGIVGPKTWAAAHGDE